MSFSENTSAILGKTAIFLVICAPPKIDMLG